MPTTLACPWCSHESTDSETFRTHLLVEHRKSDMVDYVLETHTDGAEPTQSDEPLAH